MLPDGLAPEDFEPAAPEYRGAIALADLPRLAPMLAGASGEARVRLRGARDDAGRRLVEGAVEAVVPLRCQRCLEVVEYPVGEAFSVVIVASEAEGEALPEALEPFVSADAVRPAAVVEEEILLALPVVVRHDAGVCEPPEHGAGASRAELSPFADLRGRVRQADDD